MVECVSCGRPTDGTVCHPCAQRLAARLRTAADLWPDLQAVIARQTRHGDPTPRAGRPAPAEPIRPGVTAADQEAGWPSGLPVDLAASDVADTVRSTVHTWARDIAANVGADLPDTVPEVMRWLASRMEWIRHQPTAGEALDELSDACAAVVRTVDRRATRLRVVVGPCPEDGEAGPCPGEVVAIVHEQRPAVMRCGGCGTSWDTTQWARAGRRILARKEAA